MENKRREGVEEETRNRRGTVKNEAVVFVVCFVVVYIAELATIPDRRKYSQIPVPAKHARE